MSIKANKIIYIITANNKVNNNVLRASVCSNMHKLLTVATVIIALMCVVTIVVAGVTFSQAKDSNNMVDMYATLTRHAKAYPIYVEQVLYPLKVQYPVALSPMIGAGLLLVILATSYGYLTSEDKTRLQKMKNESGNSGFKQAMSIITAVLFPLGTALAMLPIIRLAGIAQLDIIIPLEILIMLTCAMANQFTSMAKRKNVSKETASTQETIISNRRTTYIRYAVTSICLYVMVVTTIALSFHQLIVSVTVPAAIKTIVVSGLVASTLLILYKPVANMFLNDKKEMEVWVLMVYWALLATFMFISTISLFEYQKQYNAGTTTYHISFEPAISHF